MNRREFQIGPGAASLLLIAVVLCMGVLGALSLISARGDAQLSERSVNMAQAGAQLDAASEENLARLDALLVECSGAADDGEYLAQIAARLPAEFELSGRQILWTERGEGGRMLSCAAEIAPLGEAPRLYWVEHRMYTELDEGEYGEDQLLFGDEGGLLFGGGEDDSLLPSGDEPEFLD